MIKFDSDDMVIHSKLTRDEAIIFCMFLLAEKKRHAEDIKKIVTTIEYLEDKHSFGSNEILK
jgi:hypothetical protein